MTIISAPDISSIAHIPLPEALLNSHPARRHFALTIKHLSVNTATMELQQLDPSADSGNLHSLLGCIVDCAARLAAQSTLGACTLLEQELHVREPNTAAPLYVRAHVDSASARYAIYQCSIYTQEGEGHILIADSQGTLLKRAPADLSQKDGNHE